MGRRWRRKGGGSGAADRGFRLSIASGAASGARSAGPEKGRAQEVGERDVVKEGGVVQGCQPASTLAHFQHHVAGVHLPDDPRHRGGTVLRGVRCPDQIYLFRFVVCVSSSVFVIGSPGDEGEDPGVDQVLEAGRVGWKGDGGREGGRSVDARR